MKTTIYAITMLQKLEQDKYSHLPDFGDRRCIGYYDNINDALKAINTSCKSMYQNFYEYCIIEEINPGICKYSTNRYLFKWINNKYVQIDEPMLIHRVTNFSMG